MTPIELMERVAEDALLALQSPRGDERVQDLALRLNKARKAAAASDGRRRLPDDRPALTHHGRIGGTPEMDFYVTVGFYPDTHEPGEVFMHLARNGSTVSGMVDGVCVGISVALQCGYPWEKLRDKFLYTRFEPHDIQDVDYYNAHEWGNPTRRPYMSVLDALAKVIDHLVQRHKSDWDDVPMTEEGAA